jgi:CHAD domain-containing protein
VAGSIERELKVEVDEAFQVPDLTALIGVSVVSLPELTLTATYYDTEGYDLARWGATLRYRESSAGSAAWTLKLPQPAEGVGLVRSELDFEGRPGIVPDEAVRPVAAYTRGEAVRPVAELDTRRRRHLLMSATDTLAELDDDLVEFRLPSGQSGRFREIEVELSETGPVGILRRIEETLRDAGVRPADSQPKLVRAIGGPPPSVLPRARTTGAPGRSARDLVADLFTTAGETLFVVDPALRLGDDPEAVRRARFEAERLASVLAGLEKVVDATWAGPVVDELEALAPLLADLRDIDVVGGRLDHWASSLLPEEQRLGSDVAGMLAGQREVRRRALASHLESAGYRALLDSLIEAAWDPPMARGGDRPAVAVATKMTRARITALAYAVAATTPTHPSRNGSGSVPTVSIEPLRRATGEARAAAYLAVPLVGKPARRVETRLARLEAGLAAIVDSAMVQRWLRETGPQMEPARALVAGQLLAIEIQAMRAARDRWPRLWRDVQDRTGKWPGPR